MCFVSTIQITRRGTTNTIIVIIIKKCADSSLCPAAGTQTYSLNPGSGQVFAQATCCATANCNKVTPTLPSPPGNSSVQCPTCDPQTGTCTTNVTCNELETSCFQTTATTFSSSGIPTRGCASPNTCPTSVLNTFLPKLSPYTAVTGPTSCTSRTTTTVPPTTTTPAPTTTTPAQTTTTPAPTTTTPANYNYSAHLQTTCHRPLDLIPWDAQPVIL
ncbi:integumentary mucin C.1-like [Boleophthalmus pectinirostris]|uniref:integumentary mucin C.1-like n=1 Tax=Boleophthalmus pectinirostris TaxID=150288 RepID=UPI00242BE5E8|nr:integumentary mucin C.1-like [Boleophthalmus pectinirostris]